MGDIRTTTAAIVSALKADTGITASVITTKTGTLDQILESEEVRFPAILVTYNGSEYAAHSQLGARLSDATRIWRIYAIARAVGSEIDVDGVAADMVERIIAVLQGVTVDSGGGELWPVSDEVVFSSRGTVAYAVDMSAQTRMMGV